MLLAIRLVDLGAIFSMGLLWLGLGALTVVLYRWLWQTGGRFDVKPEPRPARRPVVAANKPPQPAAGEFQAA